MRHAAALLSVLFLTLLASPLAGEEATKIRRIGLLLTGAPPDVAVYVQAFRDGLRQLGHAEGRTLVIEERYGKNDLDHLDALASELAASDPDVIVAAGPYASRAAKRATATIPIVFVAAPLPIELGLITSFARPGGNASGLSWDVSPGTAAKQLELLKQSVPSMARVAYLGVRMNTVEARSYLDAMESAARALRVSFRLINVLGSADFDGAFQNIKREQANGLVVSADVLNFGHRRQILEFAAVNRLPTVYAWREAVAAGGLLSYGPSLTDLWYRASMYVDRVLKGAKPADLPVEQPTKFELVINLKTAKALGLTIPPSVLARADELMQ